MKQIIEYLLSKKNSKTFTDDALFKRINDSIEFNELKEIFEQSSYEFVENTRHEKENKNEIRFSWDSVEYIYKQFNLKEKQYLLAFTSTCEFIFAFNPEKKENCFVGYYYAEGWDKNDRGFEKCHCDIVTYYERTTLETVIEYLI